jgi:putative chitinase
MNFKFAFTTDELKRCVPGNRNLTELHQALCDVLPKYEIDTPERVAAFLAQCGHESSDFNILKENLNYSAQGLMLTWPKRFPNTTIANQYARKPEKIANKVYSNRLGNGPEISGDGWKYRGRGAIQLTGKANYQEFANSIGMTLQEVVPYLETLHGAIESACYFWQRHNLNRFADARDIKNLTIAINGGLHGFDQRKQKYIKALGVLE